MKPYPFRILATLSIMCVLVAACSDDDSDNPTSPPPEPNPTLLAVPDSYESIGEALFHAERGDTVLVAGGVYQEWDLDIPQGVRLHGAPGDTVVIDARSAPRSGRVLTAAGDPTVNDWTGIKNIAVYGGGWTALYARENLHLWLIDCEFRESRNGVVVGAYDFSFVRIDSCLFTGCGAPSDHGGDPGPNALAIEGRADVWVTYSEFTDNEGENGGAVNCRTDVGDVRFHHCNFSDNTASMNGGGIYVREVRVLLVTDSDFTGNSCRYNGGAVQVGEVTDIYLNDNVFRGNTAATGGAIRISRSLNNELDNNAFFDNVAAHGGALCLDRGIYFIDDSFFIRNGPPEEPSSSAGGAILTYHESSLYVEACTFHGNAATLTGYGEVPGGGSAIHMDSPGSSLRLRDSILAFAPAGVPVSLTDSYLHVRNCDVYGNADGDWVEELADWADVNENISADPLFCDPEGDGFDLQAESPCIWFPNVVRMGAGDVGCD